MKDITILEGDIIDTDVDVIVNPAHTVGYMGGGVALAIRKAGGKEIEEEALSRAPFEIGNAVMTTAGSLKFKGVLHAPTMERPSDEIGVYNVAMATKGALMAADELQVNSLAIPGMGTGVGNINVGDSAQAMIEEVEKFNPRYIKKVVLIDINPDMVQAWRDSLHK